MVDTLNPRKKKILKMLIEEYIEKAKPISSSELVKDDLANLSSATIRNEMLDLTRMGLLYQPHTSAGKIPTVYGFDFYLENFLREFELSVLEKTIFRQIKKKNPEKREAIKEMARKLAEISGGVVIIAFSKNDFYYTGFSYLFRQPEFKDLTLICDISEVIDRLDETMKNIFDRIEKTAVLVGNKSPFGSKSAVIFDLFRIDNQKIVIGILGLIRMNYNKNIALVNYIKELVS